MKEPLRFNHDFRLIWLSGLFAVLGTQVSTLALPLLVLRETGSTVQAGTVGSVSIASVFVTMVPGGLLADRMERRRLMQVCDLVSFSLVCLLVAFVWSGHTPLGLVLLVVGAGAIVSSVHGPAAFGLMRAVVPEKQRGVAIARLQARSATARLIGPLAGGALFAAHPVTPFMFEAAGLMGSALCVTLVRARSYPISTNSSLFSRQELTAGVSFLWRLPYVRTVLLIFGLGVNFGFSAMIFTTVTAISDGGRAGMDSGVVMSCTAAGAFAGTLLAPRLRPEKHSQLLIKATCWVCAATAGILIWIRTPVGVGIACAICMCLATVASMGFLSALLLVTPDDRVGRVQSAAAFLSSLVQPFGPLAGGALQEGIGLSATFAVIAAVLGVSATAMTLAPSARAVHGAVPRVTS